jgi:YVTN family beta-propeller protein
VYATSESEDVNQKAGILAVIDATDPPKVVDVIPVGIQPKGVAVSPDGSRVYVANNGSDYISVIRTSDRRQDPRIPIGKNAWALAMSADDKQLYVASGPKHDNQEDEIQSAGTIRVLQTVAPFLDVRPPLVLDGEPIAIAVNRQGTIACVTSSSMSIVWIVHFSSSSWWATRVMGVTDEDSPIGVSLSHDGIRAYVANFGTDSVSVIDTVGAEVEKRVPVGRNPYGVAVSWDGKSVYVTNRGDRTLSVIDVEQCETTEPCVATRTLSLPGTRQPEYVATRPPPASTDRR